MPQFPNTHQARPGGGQPPRQGPRPGVQQQGGPVNPLPQFKFFDDGGKHLHPDLLIKVAEDCAEAIYATQSRTKITNHQLRRFYNDVKSIEKRVKADPGNFAKYWPLVGMLKAKVAYASKAAQNQSKIPPEFKNFIDQSVDLIKGDEASFKAFCLFFEAVVGYLYGKGIRDN